MKDGVKEAETRDFCQRLGFQGKSLDEATVMVDKLYKVFCKYDATMIEINPMVEDNNDTVYCLDAKCRFDDNAEYRQKVAFVSIQIRLIDFMTPYNRVYNVQ